VLLSRLIPRNGSVVLETLGLKPTGKYSTAAALRCQRPAQQTNRADMGCRFK
jgi:hypothetical protein